MKVLSEKLSLVLIDYNELPDNIQKDINYIEKDKHFFRMKGMLKMLKIDSLYLYVSPEYFNKSLLVSVYGTRIDRTNEDSFDTLLCDYFSRLEMVNRVKYTEKSIEKYVKGLEIYALKNGFENLWHILNLTKQCIRDSYESNFSPLLSFYSLIEVLTLNDKKRYKANISIGEECGYKLPIFYKEINCLNFPEKYRVNIDMKDYEIFNNLITILTSMDHTHFMVEGNCGLV